MPLGLRRYQKTRQLHFVTFSCFHRLPLLKTADARDLFESALERIRHRYEFVVRGYVVMPEHVHLLVSEPSSEQLAGAIKAVKLSVALRAASGLSGRRATMTSTCGLQIRRRRSWDTCIGIRWRGD